MEIRRNEDIFRLNWVLTGLKLFGCAQLRKKGKCRECAENIGNKLSKTMSKTRSIIGNSRMI